MWIVTMKPVDASLYVSRITFKLQKIVNYGVVSKLEHKGVAASNSGIKLICILDVRLAVVAINIALVVLRSI
jgi:hypothetical protein